MLTTERMGKYAPRLRAARARADLLRALSGHNSPDLRKHLLDAFEAAIRADERERAS